MPGPGHPSEEQTAGQKPGHFVGPKGRICFIDKSERGPHMPCAIWGTPAQVLESKGGDYEVYDSPRAGGKYWISGTAVGNVNTFNDDAKRLLTTWLCEQRRAGVDTPQIDSKILDIVRARQPLPFMTRFTAALRFIGSNIKQLGDRIEFRDANNANILRLLAEAECKSGQELRELLRLLSETGFLDAQFYSSGIDARPTARGWEELDKMGRRQIESSQAFVAMWFNEETEDTYVKGIAPALMDTGYKPMRIDKKDHNNKIDDEIIAEIRRSRFIVADFTCEPKIVRGGVYFEAGFALGLGIPVIWTCRDTSINDLHFDTRQYAHVVWKEPAELYTQLKNRIGATIGDGPQRHRTG